MSREMMGSQLDDVRTFLASEFSDSPFFEDIGKLIARVQL
jgi:hypothetical protein